MSGLVGASVAVHGTYNNGGGGDNRPPYIHEVVGERPVIANLGVQEPIDQLAGRLCAAYTAMRSPSETLINDVREHKGDDIEFDGRWGYRGMKVAADRILQLAELPERFVARLAISEIDARWVMVATNASIHYHAQTILGSRAIAGHFHDLDRWITNSY